MRYVALVFLLCGLTACSSYTPANGYKVLRYSQPLNHDQAEFTILHGSVRITAQCADYYGKHIGCEQLKGLVGKVIPENQFYFTPEHRMMDYKPNGSCGDGDCEFLLVSKVESNK